LEIFDGNRRMLRTIIDNFLSDLPQDLDQLAQAAERQDAPQVRHLAHRMAGAAGMVGALRFMARARELEFAMAESWSGSAVDQARQLREEYERFQQAAAEEGALNRQP
jgi:HPt (histidine-containing phosphotransfer) domain-containing protein